MTILGLEGIEPFRGLRLSDEIIRLAPIKRTTLERLQLKEKELTEREYGLPFYLALQHHINGRTMKDLEKELGVGCAALVNIFGYYEIPRLDRPEAKIRYLKEHGDPRTRSRRIRKRQEELNNDGFPITGQERKEIIKAYDLIASHRNIKGWEELVEDVSENTGIELEAVRSCLRKYFK